MSHEREIKTFLTDEQIEKLKGLAEASGKPIDVFIGDLVKEELDRKTKPRNRGNIRCFTRSKS